MSITCGFFNSIGEDRPYDAEQMSSILDGIVLDGVLYTVPIDGSIDNNDRFLVEANGGMSILIGRGKAWFNHTWTLNDTKFALTLASSHGVNDRIDAVVLEVNTNVDKRENTIKIITGTPNTEPERPTLIRESGVFQYPLAYITVTHAVTDIASADIENVVGSADTPYARSISDSVSLQIMNSLEVTEPGYALDARQGKELQDQITSSNNAIGKINTSIDDMTDQLGVTSGTYRGAKFRFGVTSRGEYGYIKEVDGADTVIPFRKDFKVLYLGEADHDGTQFDISRIVNDADYRDFTAEHNFFLADPYFACVISEHPSVNTNTKKADYSSYGVYAKAKIYSSNYFTIGAPTLSYNPNSGALLVTGLSNSLSGIFGIEASLMAPRNGEDDQMETSQSSGGTMQIITHVKVYLVYHQEV